MPWHKDSRACNVHASVSHADAERPACGAPPPPPPTHTHSSSSPPTFGPCHSSRCWVGLLTKAPCISASVAILQSGSSFTSWEIIAKLCIIAVNFAVVVGPFSSFPVLTCYSGDVNKLLFLFFLLLVSDAMATANISMGFVKSFLSRGHMIFVEWPLRGRRARPVTSLKLRHMVARHQKRN